MGCCRTSQTNEEAIESHPHHENTFSYEKQFLKDKAALTQAFLDVGNPFLEQEDGLVHIISKHILDEQAASSVRNGQDIGQKQYDAFVSERLEQGNSSIYNNIKKNNFPLFRKKNSIVTSKSKQRITSLTSDCRLYASLYVACQSRQGNLENFFTHENHEYPISISEYGKLRKCTAKSDFLKCLDELSESSYERPIVEAKIIDGAAFINMNAPKSSETYGEYCNIELQQKFKSLAYGLRRLDIVFDTYLQNSIKSETRERRGHGIRISVRKETPIYKKFQEFMRNDNNKTELFQMIANSTTWDYSTTTIIATNLNGVVTNSIVEDVSALQPCNHEEADTRLLLHVYDASLKGLRKISIVTVDTDVVVIALYHFFSLNVEELWIEIGVGQYRRWLPIHLYANMLKEEVCRALPFWFTLTGCDTTSMFSGRGKKTAWRVWESYPDATKLFVR